METRKISRFVCLFMATLILLGNFSGVKANANAVTTLQPLIEPQTKTYKVDIINDKPTFNGKHTELKRLQYGNFLKDCSGLAGNLYSGSGKPESGANINACFNLDSTENKLLLDDKNLNNSNLSNNYDAFLLYEGYKDKSAGGNLITEDSDMKNATFAIEDYMYRQNAQGGAPAMPALIMGGSAGDVMPLSFPSVHNKGAKDATQVETERAIEIGNTITLNLNAILTTINDGKKYSSVSELVNKSILIRPTSDGYSIIPKTVNNNGYVIIYAQPNENNVTDNGSNIDTAKKSANESNPSNLDSFWANFPAGDKLGNLYAYVIPFKSDVNANSVDYSDSVFSLLNYNGASSFIYAMPKGYVKVNESYALPFSSDGFMSPWIGDKDGNIKDDAADVPYLTIHHFSFFANTVYKNHNISYGTTNTNEEGNFIINLIIALFQGLINGLRTLLGLTDMYTLIYNKGVRGSSLYNYGSMPDSWWNIVLRYHLVFQSIAWFIIIVGLIKLLIDLNISRVSGAPRARLYETLQRFIMTGFLLVTVIPIIQFMLTMNNSIVGIFATQVDPNANQPPVVASLAGMVLQFAYLGILLYVNFTYIMRSVLIGLLTVSSPFFISTIAFSGSNRGLFTTWLKEMAANIFLQSLHAFTMAFLMNLATSGGGLESLVVSYSIIPITEVFRGLIFGNAGGAASSLGKEAAAKYGMATTGMAVAGANLAAGRLNGGRAGGEEAGATGSGSGAGSGQGRQSEVGMLNNAIHAKGHGAVGAANSDAKDGNASGLQKSNAHARAAGGNAMKGLANAAKATASLAGAAMTMATGEMTGNVNAYKDVGSGLADAGAAYGNAVGNAAQTSASAAQSIGHGVAGAAEHHQSQQAFQNMQDYKSNRAAGMTATDAKAAINNKAGFSSNNPGSALKAWASRPGSGADAPPRPNSIIQNKGSGESIAEYSASSFGGGSFSSNRQAGTLTQTMDTSGIQAMAAKNPGGIHSEVQQYMALGNSKDDIKAKDAMASQWQAQGINVNANKNGAAITYNKNYMELNGLSGAGASADGTKVFLHTRAAEKNSSTNRPTQGNGMLA